MNNFYKQTKYEIEPKQTTIDSEQPLPLPLPSSTQVALESEYSQYSQYSLHSVIRMRSMPNHYRVNFPARRGLYRK